MRLFLIRISILWLMVSRVSAGPPPLPHTARLAIERPLDEIMVEGLNRYCLRELAASHERRAARWKCDFTRTEAYSQSIIGNRERYRELIGVVDERLTSGVANGLDERHFELNGSLDRSSIVARSGQVSVHSVRWPVLDGVTAEGLLLVPETIRAGVVALPEADWTPEMFCGLSGNLPGTKQLQRLAAAGCLIAIPTLISRSDEFSGNPQIGFTNQTHREFLYRQAFEAGRHVIGYEVQKALAAVDLLEHRGKQEVANSATPFPIGVIGVGEGGLIAMYSAALDPRIQSCCVSGYFQEREAVWKEPIDRNVWGLLTEFGDAEIAGLIAPRHLVIEAARAIEFTGQPVVRGNRRPSAAPGRIERIPLASVRREFDRAAATYRHLRRESELVFAVSGEVGDGPCGSDAAIIAFATGLGIEKGLAATLEPWQCPAGQQDDGQSTSRTATARQKRQLDELQNHVQGILRRSHQVRDAKWQRPNESLADWEHRRRQLRDWVHQELIGRFPHEKLPPNVRSRRVFETDSYAAYEVVLDVFDDVLAAGMLLLPKNLTADEKRPVVVCQHGLEGTPMDTISRDPKPFAYYKAFSEELVKRGFIVYAPQNPYRGGDRFRVLQRMLNPLKQSLFSIIIAQHEQTLDWLTTLPQVDSKRIAFYGLSYGGKTAMRVPPLVDRYGLSICSGDFTDWPRTIASNADRFTYVTTPEYEIPEWNLAHIANYAELAMLMSPRPFMVEAGHRDGGQPSELVFGEFGKVRRHYDQLRIGDRAELEFFDGPHTINGQGTFRFLHRHLNWPGHPETP